MNYTIEKSKGEVKLNFALTAEEWDGFVDKAFLKNKNKYSVPGFRKGHVSRKMIEKLYGEGVFFDDAFNAAFYDAYSKALDENEDIFPVDDPKVDIDGITEEGVAFHAVVTVKPEVALGDYKGIKIDKVEYNVTVDDVQAEIDRVRKQAARRVEATDRAVENGDIVNLDYSGSVDGVKFDGGTATGQELVIGSGSFIPGFEDGMIGMAIGETKDVAVKFPEQYHAENLAGKDAIFTVTVNKIEKEEFPEFNDDFVKDVSAFDTVDAYRADVEKTLTEEKTRKADSENENKLVEAVVDNATVEIPECMIERRIDEMVEEMKYRLSYMYRGLTLEDYLKYTGGTIEDLRASRKADAETEVKTRLVLEAIVKAESLEVTDEEVEAELAAMAEKQGKSAEDMKKHADARQTSYIRNEILSKKLVAFLKEVNEFVAGEAKAKKTAKKTTAKKAAKKADDAE